MENGESSLARQVLLAVAVAAAIPAQVAVHTRPENAGAWAVLGAAALLAFAVAGRRIPLPAPVAQPPAHPPGRWQRLAWGALAVAATVAATTLHTQRRLPLLALALWLLAALLGALATRRWALTPPGAAPAPPWRRSEQLALAAILVLAAAARVLWIDTLPRAIFGDEPRIAMWLRLAYAQGAIPEFFAMGWNTWPVIGLSLEGVFAPLLGGVSITALRLSSALMGTLGVLCTYLLARQLWGVRAALGAGVLFAIGRAAIDFSRLGIAHAQLFCLEPLAFWLLWRALDRGRALAWWGCGVATAWCLFSYNAGQLVPLLVAGWLVLAGLRRPARLRTHGAGALLLAAGLVVTILPYAYHVTDRFTFGPQWNEFTVMARNRQTLGRVVEAWQQGGAAPAGEILTRQVWRTWLGFGVLPDGGYAIGYRRGGMLDDVSAALFVLGLAMTLRRLGRGRDGFVAYWWLATVFAGGILTVGPPAAVRMVGLLPALALLAALPLEWLVVTGGRTWRRQAGACVGALLVIAAATQVWRTYFVELPQLDADVSSELARRLWVRPADDRALLIGPEHHLALDQELFRIELPGRTRDVMDVRHTLPLREPATTLVLGPTQVTQAAYLARLYPGATISDYQPSGATAPFFRLVTLPPGAAEARTGLTLRAEWPDGAQEGEAPVDPFAALPSEVAAAPRRVWSGAMHWPDDVEQVVTVEAAQPTTVQLGDAPPLHADAGTPAQVVLTLPRGWQSLRIEETAAAAPRALRIIVADSRGARPLTRWDLRPDSDRHGLSARYETPSGIVRALDPQLNDFLIEQRDRAERIRTPFRATWRGALRVTVPGTYEFHAIGSGPYRIALDDAPLLDAPEVDPEQPWPTRTTRDLTPGLHPIIVEYDHPRLGHTTRRIFQLFWTPPGGERELVPPEAFVPFAEPGG